MKLTDKDKSLFDALHGSATGSQLVEYLDRLQTELCDSRTWGDNDTKETSLAASNKIQKHIIDKITNRNEAKEKSKNDYE